jgi:dTDP-4-amino-4,6-dideoxygalactose transaminase
MLAAFLYAQLEAHAVLQSKRKRVWENYNHNLKKWAIATGATLPCIPDYIKQPYHMFYLLLPSLDFRQSLIAHLKERSILSVFHYLPLHTSEMGQRFGGKPGDCPVTEDVSDRLLRLPFYAGLEEVDQEKVIHSIINFTHV